MSHLYYQLRGGLPTRSFLAAGKTYDMAARGFVMPALLRNSSYGPSWLLDNTGLSHLLSLETPQDNNTLLF